MQKRFSSEQRRAEILREALDILFVQGSHGLTMRNLAERIGLSEASLYRHFRNKEEIVQTLTDQTCNTLDQDWDSRKPLVSLKMLMDRQLANIAETPHLTAIVFEEEIFREYPAVRLKLQQHRRKKEDVIISLVRQGQAQRIFDRNLDAQIFSLLFMGGIRMAVLKWKESDFSYSLLEQGERIMAEFRRLLEGEAR